MSEQRNTDGPPNSKSLDIRDMTSQQQTRNRLGNATYGEVSPESPDARMEDPKSDAARTLAFDEEGQELIIKPQEQTSPDRLEEVRRRASSGFYFTREVYGVIAGRLLEELG